MQRSTGMSTLVQSAPILNNAAPDTMTAMFSRTSATRPMSVVRYARAATSPTAFEMEPEHLGVEEHSAQEVDEREEETDRDEAEERERLYDLRESRRLPRRETWAPTRTILPGQAESLISYEGALRTLEIEDVPFLRGLTLRNSQDTAGLPPIASYRWQPDTDTFVRRDATFLPRRDFLRAYYEPRRSRIRRRRSGSSESALGLERAMPTPQTRSVTSRPSPIEVQLFLRPGEARGEPLLPVGFTRTLLPHTSAADVIALIDKGAPGARSPLVRAWSVAVYDPLAFDFVHAAPTENAKRAVLLPGVRLVDAVDELDRGRTYVLPVVVAPQRLAAQSAASANVESRYERQLSSTPLWEGFADEEEMRAIGLGETERHPSLSARERMDVYAASVRRAAEARELALAEARTYAGRTRQQAAQDIDEAAAEARERRASAKRTRAQRTPERSPVESPDYAKGQDEQQHDQDTEPTKGERTTWDERERLEMQQALDLLYDDLVGTRALTPQSRAELFAWVVSSVLDAQEARALGLSDGTHDQLTYFADATRRIVNGTTERAPVIAWLALVGDIEAAAENLHAREVRARSEREREPIFDRSTGDVVGFREIEPADESAPLAFEIRARGGAPEGIPQVGSERERAQALGSRAVQHELERLREYEKIARETRGSRDLSMRARYADAVESANLARQRLGGARDESAENIAARILPSPSVAALEVIEYPEWIASAQAQENASRARVKRVSRFLDLMAEREYEPEPTDYYDQAEAEFIREESDTLTRLRAAEAELDAVRDAMDAVHRYVRDIAARENTVDLAGDERLQQALAELDQLVQRERQLTSAVRRDTDLALEHDAREAEKAGQPDIALAIDAQRAELVARDAIERLNDSVRIDDETAQYADDMVEREAAAQRAAIQRSESARLGDLLVDLDEARREIPAQRTRALSSGESERYAQTKQNLRNAIEAILVASARIP